MANMTDARPVEKPETVRTHSSLGMIGLPVRGEKAALPWLVGGLLFYVAVSWVFFNSLLAADTTSGSSLWEIIGLGESPNPTIAVLVLTGVLVTLAAMFSVARDRREISKEESDIEWLHIHGAEYAQLVLAPANNREQLRRTRQRTVDPADQRVETLVDDRVRRMMSVQGSARSTMVPVEELRIIAQTRTARLGGFARYATSLLLLLAVLGTFAGVKTALPSLIEAVSAGDQFGATDAPISIVEPLRAVADAFGANALALIGAIAVGLMAHGIAAGRRNLLERLELVSAEYIYGTSQMDSTDPLRNAVEAMNKTVMQVRETSGSLLGIESGLTNLAAAFQDAFESLDSRLTALVEQQDERLHERTSAALDELRQRVGDMAGVVEANTLAYAGLVDRIGERSEEARNAIQQLKTANERLAAGLEGVANLAGARTEEAQEAIQELKTANERLAAGLEGVANLAGVAQKGGEEVTASIERIETSTTQVRQQVEALSTAVNLVGPPLQQVQQALTATSQQITELNTRTVGSLEDLNRRAADTWVNAGREMEQYIRHLASSNGRSSAPEPVGSDATQLLRQIAHSLDGRSNNLSPVHFVVLPALGIVLGGIVLYALYAFWHSNFIAWLLTFLGIG